ncbi:MAG: hypothetical protein WA254_16520 [Candidatus Sulfotelmatobacter sp.]
MGTGLFEFIAQACQSLAATAAPSITAMGIHIVLALATIMLVWFGVQEALASAHGGDGFSMGRFLNLFMLLTFTSSLNVSITQTLSCWVISDPGSNDWCLEPGGAQSVDRQCRGIKTPGWDIGSTQD